MYRYSLTPQNGPTTYVEPWEAQALKIGGKREGENIFYRRKLQGEVVLRGEDYRLLYDLENSGARCGNVRFLIEKQCGTAGTYKDYWAGVFTMTDCKFNYDACEVTVTPEPDDAYRLILENYGKEYNVLKTPLAGFSVKAQLDLGNTFEFKYIEGDKVGDEDEPDTWAVFLQLRNWIDGRNGSFGTREHNDVIFRLTRTAPFMDIGGSMVAPDLSRDGWRTIREDTGTQTAYYAKAPTLYNWKPFIYEKKADWYNKYPGLLQKELSGDTWDATRYVEVTGAGGANSGSCGGTGINFRYYVTENRCRRLIWELGAFHFTRGRRLVDVLDYLVAQVAPKTRSGTPEAQSRFFTEATNYVTKRANDLVDVLLFQKTDVLSYSSSEAATKGEISLKSLLDELRAAFQVYWFLDESGKFRLEHLSYFIEQGTTDLTGRPDWADWLKGTRQYDYLKSAMPRYERLTFAEGLEDAFLKSEIEYVDDCVNKQEGQDASETTVTKITTDLTALLVGGSGSNAGFVLMAHRAGSVLKSPPIGTLKPLPNAPLSAVDLMANYWRHGRVLLGGKVNGLFNVFASTVKTRKQAPITVPTCCEEVNPYHTFTSTLGSGATLDSWTEQLSPATTTFVLLHQAPANTSSGPARAFDDSFDESAG